MDLLKSTEYIQLTLNVTLAEVVLNKLSMSLQKKRKEPKPLKYMGLGALSLIKIIKLIFCYGISCGIMILKRLPFILIWQIKIVKKS